MKTKKKVTGLICVCVALAVFTASAIAAASNVSGYQRLKNFAFELIDNIETLDNATIEVSTSLVQDGVELYYDRMTEMLDISGHKRYHSNQSSNGLGGGQFASEFYRDDHMNIRTVINSTYGSTYYETLYDDAFYPVHPSFFDYSYSSHYSDTSPAQRRLAELIIDAVTGDAKNCLSYDGDRISVRLSDRQIPELIQLVVAVFAEDAAQNNGSMVEGYGDGLFLGADARISELWFEAALGPDGISADASGKMSVSSTVDGVPHTFSVLAGVKIYDVGSTVISKPDVTGMDDGFLWEKIAREYDNFPPSRELYDQPIDYNEHGMAIYGYSSRDKHVYHPFYGFDEIGFAIYGWNDDGSPDYTRRSE